MRVGPSPNSGGNMGSVRRPIVVLQQPARSCLSFNDTVSHGTPLDTTQVVRGVGSCNQHCGASSACGGPYLHRTMDQLELAEGQGTIFRKDRRKPQLCT